MTLPIHQDPMGAAIRDFHLKGKAKRLRVLSSMFDEDEIPVSTLFRTENEMNTLERQALNLCHGRVLDVGAGAGSHSQVLQQRGFDTTAIDISPLSVQTMRERGILKALHANFFTDSIEGAPFDTVLMLMNGIGIVGRMKCFADFFARLDTLLTPDGQLLTDSSDLRYIFEDEDGTFCYDGEAEYYGEVDYRMVYGSTRGPRFHWLYADFDTLAREALQYGFRAEKVLDGQHYDYLARITRHH